MHAVAYGHTARRMEENDVTPWHTRQRTDPLTPEETADLLDMVRAQHARRRATSPPQRRVSWQWYTHGGQNQGECRMMISAWIEAEEQDNAEERSNLYHRPAKITAPPAELSPEVAGEAYEEQEIIQRMLVA